MQSSRNVGEQVANVDVLYQITGLLLRFWDAYRFYLGHASIADKIDSHFVFTRIKVLVQLRLHLQQFLSGQETFKQ